METQFSQGGGDLDHVFESAASYFAMLAEPMRLKILHAICGHERTVTEIVSATGATQTTVSRHLNAMHRAGALARRRDRNFTWYSVADATLTELCRTVCVHVASRDLFAASTVPPLSSVDRTHPKVRSQTRKPQ
jgi:DNA-binding transcriptional ArsR family regulator